MRTDLGKGRGSIWGGENRGKHVVGAGGAREANGGGAAEGTSGFPGGTWWGYKGGNRGDTGARGQGTATQIARRRSRDQGGPDQLSESAHLRPQQAAATPGGRAGRQRAGPGALAPPPGHRAADKERAACARLRAGWAAQPARSPRSGPVSPRFVARSTAPTPPVFPAPAPAPSLGGSPAPARGLGKQVEGPQHPSQML